MVLCVHDGMEALGSHTEFAHLVEVHWGMYFLFFLMHWFLQPSCRALGLGWAREWGDGFCAQLLGLVHFWKRRKERDCLECCCCPKVVVHPSTNLRCIQSWLCSNCKIQNDCPVLVWQGLPSCYSSSACRTQQFVRDLIVFKGWCKEKHLDIWVMEMLHLILACSFFFNHVLKLLHEDLVLLFLFVCLVWYHGLQKAKDCHVGAVGCWRRR